ncbi:tyrosine-type recombinase/integrase [Synechocystis sp. PCC 7509]|uniref:tyrosine-type recombinase/integrase n=1 Tax=Synechocystis sp. PCC 7509 TaxID=927677 RepID=UPI0002AD0855|nr:tyrosine-type recombinase/integrase [Synechocystis sp. PCC 7509]
MTKLPPRKLPFSNRRDRQFLYLHEVDALIAASIHSRAPTRNQALIMLLFCQALQPSEICWLRWCDLNFTAHTLLIVRNRSKSLRLQPQVVVNQQPLCPAEIEILQELIQLSKTDWILESERKQRLSDRSLHHIVHQAGKQAGLPLPVHPYMLRRSGLYYRAALLLQRANLSLHECCLLWNYYATSSAMTASAQIEYRAIERKREETFLLAFEQIKAFAGISSDENVIDYLLGAYLLSPHLSEIFDNYWLTPAYWRLKTLPKTFKSIRSTYS